MMVIAINDAINAYSIDVAPLSFFKKRPIKRGMAVLLCSFEGCGTCWLFEGSKGREDAPLPMLFSSP